MDLRKRIAEVTHNPFYCTVVDNLLTLFKAHLEEQLEGLKVMGGEEVRIWDKELPSFFNDTVFSPEYELETYGLSVAQAQLEDVKKQLRGEK